MTGEKTRGFYNTTCPHCGAKGNLYIIQATWMGETLLHEDGFAFVDADVSWGTGDEIVRCKKCGRTMVLGELTL